MGFSSSEDKATSEGGGRTEENALQASLLGGGSSSGRGEDNAVKESMELADQDNIVVSVPNLPPLCQHLSTPTQINTGNENAEM